MISNLDVGGAQEVVRSLVPRLRDHGCIPGVVTLRDGPLRAGLEAVGVPVTVLEGRRRSLVRDPRAIGELRRLRRDLARVVEREDAQIIQTHLLRGLDFLVLRLGRRGRRPRVAWTFHNARLELRADQVPQAGWVLDIKRWAYRTLYRRASRAVGAMVAVSADVATALERDLAPVPGRVVVIPNGVDLERYGLEIDRDETRRAAGLPVDATLAICVAKLHEQKGHRVLVDALARVAPAHPELHVVLLGTGPLAEDVAARAAAAGVGDRLHMLGERRDVAALLGAADIFVLPSLWEGLPMALLEAMASGLPVLATAVSGTRQVVENEESGLLVPPGDAEALTGGMARLAGDAALRARLGAAGRAQVAARFSVDAQARQHAELYRRLLAPHPPRCR